MEQVLDSMYKANDLVKVLFVTKTMHGRGRTLSSIAIIYIIYIMQDGNGLCCRWIEVV